MNTLGIRPLWKQGFARSAADARYPGLRKGLVGLWAPLLGPSGITLFDVSGRKNDGTLTNMDPATDWILGDPQSGGYALDFVHSDQYVNCGTNTILQPDAFSIYARVRTPATAAQNALFALTTGSGNSPAFYLPWSLANDRPLLFLGDSNFRYWDALTYDDTWMSLVVQIPGAANGDISNAKLWINGIERGAVSTNTSGAQDAKSSFRIGRGDNPKHFGGTVSEVAMWNRVISPNEIATLARPNTLLELEPRIYPAAVAAPPSDIVVLRRRMEAA